jgi:hypothetical protein
VVTQTTMVIIGGYRSSNDRVAVFEGQQTVVRAIGKLGQAHPLDNTSFGSEGHEGCVVKVDNRQNYPSVGPTPGRT